MKELGMLCYSSQCLSMPINSSQFFSMSINAAHCQSMPDQGHYPTRLLIWLEVLRGMNGHWSAMIDIERFFTSMPGFFFDTDRHWSILIGFGNWSRESRKIQRTSHGLRWYLVSFLLIFSGVGWLNSGETQVFKGSCPRLISIHWARDHLDLQY